MKYKHIFFDLDHTLWDFEANATLTLQDLYQRNALSERGITSFDDFYARYSVHNNILWDRFRKGIINRKELRFKRFWLTFLEYKIADEKLCQLMSEQFLQVLPTKTALFPYAVDVLDYLAAKNYPLHLITNGFEETQFLKMKHAGIDKYFTHVITSESAGSLKPHREIFDYAMQKAATTAGESIMIGDTLDVDILGAHNVGMDQVYFCPGTASAGVTPTHTISCLSELKNIL